MTFAPGENVGPYRIIEQLGQGGMATVYKAYHPSLDRYVAIKGMHTALTQDPNFLARFRREAQVVAKLEHPNIVPVYDFSEHQGQPYLVMKFIQGETLKARLNRGRLADQEILQVVEAVGAALSYAHERGILHRDIKPSNVLLGEDGRIYLTDFGLARIAQAGESTMSADMMLGTPQYISPEQALGKQDLDEGTDIYSFGVMLYEMTVGQVPYSADTPYSIVHDHIYTPLPLPRARNTEVPEAVERVLLKALAKQREARYPDVASLVRAFKDAFLGEPSPAPAGASTPPPEAVPGGGATPSGATPAVGPAAPTEVAPRRTRRWRWWMIVPIGLVLLVCAVLALGALSDETPDAAPDTPIAQVDIPPEPTQPPPDQPPGQLPPGTTAIDQALQNVEQHPDDPFARLELAGAYWDAGQFDDAVAAFEQAVELGGEDIDFYLAAGDFLFDREVWLWSAEMYLIASVLNDNAVPPRVLPRLERAAFNAANDPDITQSEFFNQDLRLRGLTPFFIQTVRARRVLYFGEPEQVPQMLEEIFQLAPGYPPALLLEAEFQAKTGNREAALAILEDLVNAGTGIGWVQVQARALLFELEQ